MPHKDPLERRLYHQRYREKNREKLRARTTTDEYRKKNRERAARYRLAHPDRVNENARRARIKRRIKAGKDNMRDAFAKGRIVHVPKTHCKRGHEFTPENTYRWKGHRICRECGRLAYRNKRAA